MKVKNLLVAQSGGPTAAINATLAGVVEQAMLSGFNGKIYGGIYGIKGILEENIQDIGKKLASTNDLELLASTPAAALGSCRFKLKEDAQLEQLIQIFRKFEIGYFVYIGGNDSMDTVNRLSAYCAKNNITDISIMGAPKTVDNDLRMTDHTPGFGSAAKFVAVTVSELMRDILVYDKPAVTIVEIMGRDAGWLTAAASLAKINGRAPQLIYLPEVAFDVEKFIADVKRELEKNPAVMVCVSEGIKLGDGRYVFEAGSSLVEKDVFGNAQLSGTASTLTKIVKDALGCKVRAIELNLLQRCASHIASDTDIKESKMLGAKAFAQAFLGISGEMAAIRRVSDSPYKIELVSVPVSQVANLAKEVPMDFLNEEKNNVSEKMTQYLLPLIQGERAIKYKHGLPRHMDLGVLYK